MKPFLISSVISLIAGCLYATAYPTALGAGWFPILFIAVPLFLWNLERSNFKKSLFHILLFNVGLNLVGYYWIPATLREFGELPYLTSVLLGMLFSLILQPHWWSYAIWKKFRPQWRWQTERGILVTALIMTMFERYVPQQFLS